LSAKHWTTVLKNVAEITKSKSAILAYRDLEQPQASFMFAHNISAQVHQLCATKYSRIDPFFDPSARTVPLGKTSADHQMVPDRRELEKICEEFFTGTGIASGMSLQEIADTHGTSKHTVRSQINTVFRKLNVSRQAELVKVLLLGPFGLVT
jgi:hypothetical protein